MQKSEMKKIAEEIDKTYNDAINNIKQDINKTQLDIMINANINLVNLYYRIGKVLYDNSTWGNKFLDKLAFELKNNNQKYIVYTFNEKDNDNIKTYVSRIREEENGVYFDAITDPDEWKMVREAIMNETIN